jgi:hypothetical protein
MSWMIVAVWGVCAGAVPNIGAPGQPVPLAWPDGDGPSGEVTLVDWHGRETGAVGSMQPDGMLRLPEAPGFYLLKGSTPPAGVMVLGVPGEPDPFFGMDMCLSWFFPDQPEKQALYLDMLHMMGCSSARERIRWRSVSSGPGTWDEGNAPAYDAVRAQYNERNVGVLDVLHDSPAWLQGPDSVYPADLATAAAAFSDLGGRFGKGWIGIEPWNEPDLAMFSGGAPADVYASWQRAAAWGHQNGPAREVPLAGGILTHICPHEFRLLAVSNGLLDHCDFLSLHTYESPLAMEAFVRDWRRWLSNKQMPIWITESGLPKPSGADFATEIGQAVDIAMKAVEARACGVARHFGFILPYYKEADSLYGFTDAQGRPRPAFATYAACAALLSGKRYAGDLILPGTGELHRARVFKDRVHAVTVLYAGWDRRGLEVELPMQPRAVHGADGRPLPWEGRIVRLDDGMAYVISDTDDTRAHVNWDTEATKLLEMAESFAGERDAPSPLVPQYLPGPGVESTPTRYIISEDAAVDLPVKVRLYNLSYAPIDVAARCDPAGVTREITLRASSYEDITWTIPLIPAASLFRPTTVSVSFLSDFRTPSLDLKFGMDASLQTWLKVLEVAQPVDLQVLTFTASASTDDLTGSFDGEGVWRLEARFPEGVDRWAYPTFDLPEDLRPDMEGGFLVRARLMQPGTAQVILMEENPPYGYIAPLFPANRDDQWRVYYLPMSLFTKLVSSSRPEGGLGSAPITKISFGFNSEAMENTLEISHVYVTRWNP